MKNYSPHPLTSYHIPGVDKCEFRAMGTIPESDAVWNLYWLSNPAVDTLPGSTPQGWWHRYRSWAELFGATLRDAMHDERMNYMLKQTPATFHAWFCKERDYTIYDCFDVMGARWVENVVTRSNDAAVRRLITKPFIRSDGRALRIDYDKVA